MMAMLLVWCSSPVHRILFEISRHNAMSCYVEQSPLSCSHTLHQRPRMSAVHLDGIFAGCNRDPDTADWCHELDLVAFAAASTICVYSPTQCRIVCALRGHNHDAPLGARVNAVHWLPTEAALQSSSSRELVSASADRTVGVWIYHADTNTYARTATLAGHEHTVQSVCSYQCADGSMLLSSVGGDRTVRIWKRGPLLGSVMPALDDPCWQWTLIQTISYAAKRIMMCSAFSEICTDHGTVRLLAVGGADGCVHVLAQQSDGQFVSALQLEGHQDWIRSLAFTVCDDNSLLLASAAQDNYVRLWKFSTLNALNQSLGADSSSFGLFSSQNAVAQHRVVAVEKARSTRCDTLSSTPLGSRGHLICVHRYHDIEIQSQEFAVILDAVLSGHEDWVFSVRWHPRMQRADSTSYQPMCLLTASMDKSMMIWRPDPNSSLWLNDVRVGEVGGHTLGLFGGVFGPQGRAILAHGYNGAFHLWRNTSDAVEDRSWKPALVVSGHFNGVQDLCWDSTSSYVVTTSLDQTTRVLAPWSTQEQLASHPTWHEIARPQTHGFDINCICALPHNSEFPVHRFASGAAEKVLRVFDAPQPFLGTLANLSACVTADVSKVDRALGAVIPELGLSNKPIMPIGGETAPPVNSNNTQNGNAEEATEEPNNDALGSLDDEEGGSGLLSPQAALASANAARRAAVSLVRPPLEEALIEHTMWPECNKLYGHAFELVACAATNRDCDGTVAVPLVAATCVARQADHSVIRIWETKSWREVAVLPGHSLSVAQMQFSHNNRYLLSVSRDRSYCLYVRDGTEFGFRLLHSERSAHARIVWTCSFAHDDKYFATGSRDKHVKVWRLSEDGASLDSTLPEFAQGVTAVAFAPFSSIHDGALLAVGLEDGAMQLWLGRPEASSLKWSLVFDFNNGMRHDNLVRRLAWQDNGNEAANHLKLASCSLDHSVRIISIDVKQLVESELSK